MAGDPRFCGACGGPLGRRTVEGVPRLAFPAHEEAIARCLAEHRDAWAIQDSFAYLEGGGETLISDALVRLVEEHAEEISRRWVAVVRGGPTTPTYASLPPGMVQEKALIALSKFCSRLSGEAHEDELAAFYRLLGRQRRGQGFALHEV